MDQDVAEFCKDAGLIKPSVDVKVDKGAKIGRILLGAAIMSGDLKTVRHLLSRGVGIESEDPDTGDHPLHFAAKANNPAMLNFLISAGANPQALNFSGETPLGVAQKHGKIKAVSILGSFKDGLSEDEEIAILHPRSLNFAPSGVLPGLTENIDLSKHTAVPLSIKIPYTLPAPSKAYPLSMLDEFMAV